MTASGWKRNLLGALALLFLILLSSPAPPALDVGDIKSLLRNQVAEEVIVNLVRSGGPVSLAPGEADELRSLGASENLLAALSVPAAPASAAILAPPDDLAPVTPLEIGISGAYPPLGDKEGWLSISNHDPQAYHLTADVREKRIFVSRHPNGGLLIGPGQSVVLTLRKEEYKLYGDSGRTLKVKVRENETTHLSFNPFGVQGNNGMTGVVVDRERTRSEVLFDMYASAPPTIIVQEAPPPVLVTPGYPWGWSHQPYPPHRGGRRHGGGGGMSFHFGW